MFSGRKKTEKGCSKIDAKKMMRNLEPPKPNPRHRRDRFGAGGEVRRGQAPPGPAISGSDSASKFNTPCTRRGAAENLCKIDARKRHAKSIEIETQKAKIARKSQNEIEKRHAKNDARFFFPTHN